MAPRFNFEGRRLHELIVMIIELFIHTNVEGEEFLDLSASQTH